MEGIVTTNNGVTVMLAGLIVILCLHLVMKIVSLALDAYKKKSETTDLLAINVKELSTRLSALERDMNEILKFRHDFRRLFTAVKALSGDKWPEIRKAVLQDDLRTTGDDL